MKRLGCILLLVCLGTGCSRPASTPRPNILVITIDTLRRDRVGAYGGADDVTPTLDQLAREGVVFEQAISVASWTKPTVVSLLTGLHPHQHRVFRGGTTHADMLSRELPTVAEGLRQAGYATGAFVDNEHLMRRFSGLDRGFDTYAEELGAAPLVVHAFLDWLARTPSRPFAAYLHLLDPHWPYTTMAPRPGQTRSPEDALRAGHWAFGSEHWWLLRNRVNDQRLQLSDAEVTTLRDLYDDEVWQTDAVVGRLLTWLAAAGMLDNTLVIVTSDHGEGFLEHARLDHGYGPYDELLRIPLIVRFPGAAHAGTRYSGVVQPTDIAATMLHVAGATVPPEVVGMPLTQLVEQPPARDDRAAYSEERYGGMTVASLRTATHKYIRREVSPTPAIAATIDVPAELEAGDRVQVEGVFSNLGLVAAQVRRIDNEDRDVELQGPISTIETNAGHLQLLGYKVDIGPRTALRQGEQHLELREFAPLDWVRAQGAIANGVLIASKLERINDPLAHEIEIEAIIEEIVAVDGEAALRLGQQLVRVDRKASWRGVATLTRSLGTMASPPALEAPEELYDLSLDPGERRDLAPANPPVLAELRQRMTDLRDTLVARGGAPAAGAVLDPASRDRLRALGYLE